MIKISHLLHACDHLRLPVYQLICLPVHLLLPPVHLYFLDYNVRVDGILRPVWISLYIEFFFFGLGFNSLAESLKILIVRTHWCLGRRRILLGRKFGTYKGSSCSVRGRWTLTSCGLGARLNDTRSCARLLFLSGLSF